MEHAVTFIRKALVVRAEPGEDLVPALIEAASAAHVREALISPVLGSLERIRLVIPVGREAGHLIFSDPIDYEGPVEIIGGGGFLCRNEGGEPELHLHLTVCLASGELAGGHVLPSGNPVLATVECGLLVPGGVRLVRRRDARLGVPVLHPEARHGQAHPGHGGLHAGGGGRTRRLRVSLHPTRQV
ncbi:hypothetical protein Spith_0626 [Spirochaeta thermophila DSM 6578]|uniref:PPC domain-containing protein n=1 Tax=Winmispira thermophila (strain ATCC 700085 / DSM 6578 / Z-1203) TaxID=869211 RepID=G0GA70_WINT7|nr:PPC domain-containing DNA-binding protein [Spirochaeta thermophila]AEJ60906.1 hypothetical protein Spith_0626 [Spirochaeta thermophila DSM 6578]